VSNNPKTSLLQRLSTQISKATRRTSSTESSEELKLEKLNKLIKESATRNIKVYSCSSDGSIKVTLGGMLGSFILLFSSYNMWMIYGYDESTPNKLKNETGFFRASLETIYSKWFAVASCLSGAVAGAGITATVLFFTSRSVNHLYLLKGGRQLGLITDGMFGRKFELVFNLEETTFKSTRMARKSQIFMKNKQHRFHYMLNNIEGVFHEKELFDLYICQKRFE
jgi:hypothetical protein